MTACERERPALVEKVIDVVGLYLDPPERAVVLCVDLADMDAGGVDLEVLSHTVAATEQFPPEQAVALAEQANDYLAAAVAAHPDRFVAFATLPTPAPDAAADEFERAVTGLGF